MNFTLFFVHLFGLIQSTLRGWGFAFGRGRADIQNRDCLYKNPDSSKKYGEPYTKIQTLRK